jgi:hypothetical protein
MKVKLFSRIALEANEDEQAAEDGLNTNVVIDESPVSSEDAPVEDAGAADEAPAEEVDPADAEIEYPDVGNLEVDKVSEVIAEDEEDDRQAQVADALAATSQLNAAVEAMRLVIAREGRLNPVMASNASAVLEYNRERLGFRDTRPKFAMENYCGFTQKQSVLALEGYVETIRHAWAAIITAIKNALTWLKKAFVAFFVGTARNMKNTTELTNAILKVRKDSRYTGIMGKAASGNNAKGDGAAAPSQLIDKEHYVSLDVQKRFLSFNGKLPGSGEGLPSQYRYPVYDANGNAVTGSVVVPTFTQAFENLLGLVSTHSNYPILLNDAMIKQLEEVAGCIERDLPLPNVPIAINPILLGKSDWFFSTKSDVLDAVPGAGFIVNGFFLGSFQVERRINLSANLNVTDSMINLGVWATRVADSRVAAGDGWMRYLDTTELVSASATVMNLGHELLAYEKTLDVMTAMQERFKELAVKAAATAGSMPADFFDKTSANGWRGETVTQLMRALNSIVLNVNLSLFQYASRANASCSAWNTYLKEILDKETQLVQTA